MDKRYLGIVLVLVSLFLWSACAKPEPAPTTPQAPAPKVPATTPVPAPKPSKVQLVFATIQPGTSYYIGAVGVSDIINEYTELEVTVQSFSPPASRETIGKGEADMVWYTTPTMYNYLYGEREYKGTTATYLRVLLTGAEDPYGCVTYPATGIKTLSDIRGKQFAFPKLFAPIQTLGDALFSEYGLKPGVDFTKKDVSTIDEGGKLVRERKADVTFSTLHGTPVRELDAALGAYVIPLDRNKLEAAIKAQPGWYPIVIQPGTPGVKEPTVTFSATQMVMVHKDFPEDVAKIILDAVSQHIEELRGKAAMFEEWKSSMLVKEGLGLPYHSGAIMYFKEKGMWTDKMEAENKEILDRLSKL